MVHPPGSPASRLGRAIMEPRWLAALGLLSILALAVALTWYGFRSRQIAIEGAVRELQTNALMLVGQQQDLLDTVDGIQAGLIETMRRSGIDTAEKFEKHASSEAVQQDLRDRLGGLAPVAALWLSDRRGRLLNSSSGLPAAAADDVDQDFFRDTSAPGLTQPLISVPRLSAATGEWSFNLIRRFDAADGRLIGIVFSTFRIARFQEYPGGLSLSGDFSFTPDAPASAAEVGRVASWPRGNGAVQDGSFDRFILRRPMTHFPLTVTIVASLDSPLRRWNREMCLLGAATILLDLLIAAIVLLVVRGLRTKEKLKAVETALYKAEIHLAVGHDRERNEAALRVQERRFDLAMENLIQGLVIADLDECILAVNRRYCEIWGLPPNIVTSGMSCRELESLAVSGGSIKAADLTEIRRRREEVADMNSPSSFVWELVDGRAFRVNQQPTDEGWLTTYEDISDQRMAEAQIAYLAQHDVLTNLPNRVLFLESLERALALSRRGHLMALHHLDLDKFAVVNDTFGHFAGDRLLQAVAQRLAAGVRESDTVARLGGDEFAIIQIPINSPLDATRLANRVMDLIKAPFIVEGRQIVIGTRIGIAFAPDDGLSADELAKCADLALHQAKSDGSAAAHLYDAKMDAAMRSRNALEADLRQALRKEQFELFFQPQIDVRARRIAGCEALLRWRHPTKGLVPPDQFIPLAEETGLIVPLGEWVLRQACATAVADWPDDIRVAVNLSGIQFRDNNMVDLVSRTLHDSGLDASRLELEITETVMLKDTASALTTLHKLRELGVHIAMDDFGTGYSSLSYLRRFPFNRIKIDQSFVRDLGKQEDCMSIVRAVITLGRDLGMSITAEGVETLEQLLTLEDAGCNEVQGYLFSRPVEASAAAALLRSGSIIAKGWPPDNGPPRAGGLIPAGMQI